MDDQGRARCQCDDGFVANGLDCILAGNGPDDRPLTTGVPNLELLDTYQVGYRYVSSREPVTGEVEIHQAPYVIDQPGRYILMADLVVERSAILIKSHDVTLDLNGHTVTYGTGHHPVASSIMTYNSRQLGNVGHHGITAPDRPDVTEDWMDAGGTTLIGWNWAFTNVVIRNGVIIAGDGPDLTYSPAVYVNGLKGAVLERLVVAIDTPDSEAMIIGEDSHVRQCTLIHTGKVVSNRHQILAVTRIHQGSRISYTQFEGAPQAGVKAEGAPSQPRPFEIDHNIIRQSVMATNGYAVFQNSKIGSRIHHNYIVPYEGRGIHVNGIGEVDNNYIEVRQGSNAEYPRMEAHGIKLEGATAATVHDNVVLSVSLVQGRPTPLNLDVPAEADNLVNNSTFVAVNRHADQPSWGLYMLASDGTGTVVRDNTFYVTSTGEAAVVGIPWDGANHHRIQRCHFRALDQDQPIPFFNFGFDKDSHNIEFVDCRFMDGIDRRHFSGLPTEEASGGYAVRWTVRVVSDLPANVDVHDGSSVVATSTVGGEAAFLVELTEFQVSVQAPERTPVLTEHAPYTLTVSHGSSLREFTIIPRATMELHLTSLEERGPMILVPHRPTPAVVGTSYLLDLVADGDSAARETDTWSISAGNLPAGLTITGHQLSGIPQEAGEHAWTLHLSRGGVTTTKNITLAVEQADERFWRERVARAQQEPDDTPARSKYPIRLDRGHDLWIKMVDAGGSLLAETAVEVHDETGLTFRTITDARGMARVEVLDAIWRKAGQASVPTLEPRTGHKVVCALRGEKVLDASARNDESNPLVITFGA